MIGNHESTEAETWTVTRLPLTDTDCSDAPEPATKLAAAARAAACAAAGSTTTVPLRAAAESRALAPALAASKAIEVHWRSADTIRPPSIKIPTPATPTTENSTMNAAR